MTFVNQMFSSEDFCRDYNKYLERFEEIMEADNRRKMMRLGMHIEECVNKNKNIVSLVVTTELTG